jgi:hypothetical protein
MILSDIRDIPIAFLLLVVSTNTQHNLRETTPPSPTLRPGKNTGKAPDFLARNIGQTAQGVLYSISSRG